MRLGRVVRKSVRANPRLKVDPSIHFRCTKMFSIDYVLRSLRFFKLKPEGKTNRKLSPKVTKLKSKFSLTLG